QESAREQEFPVQLNTLVLVMIGKMIAHTSDGQGGFEQTVEIRMMVPCRRGMRAEGTAEFRVTPQASLQQSSKPPVPNGGDSRVEFALHLVPVPRRGGDQLLEIRRCWLLDGAYVENPKLRTILIERDLT